jgi:hypothetical protein
MAARDEPRGHSSTRSIGKRPRFRSGVLTRVQCGSFHIIPSRYGLALSTTNFDWATTCRNSRRGESASLKFSYPTTSIYRATMLGERDEPAAQSTSTFSTRITWLVRKHLTAGKLAQSDHELAEAGNIYIALNQPALLSFSQF